MYALTVRRPWASLIAHAGKNIENRSWLPYAAALGARIAIHAGQGFDAAEADELGLQYPQDQPAGVIVCTAAITGWVHEDGTWSESLTAGQARKLLKSQWFMGPYGWVLSDVQPPPKAIAGRPFRGSQGLWVLP